MKIVAFIMAFLVLALSIMPCADEAVLANDGHANVKIAAKSSHQENPQQDECTPFCHCTCCAGFSLTNFLVSFSALTPPESKAVSANLPADEIEIALPVWQPPQLLS